ncbi:MAG: hypothetical protein GXP52_09885 [Deltaproteobacteria bacterium]|nr:hypothetical protein [Deltaproteobacteria bacterium]
MKKLKPFLLIFYGLLFYSGIAYAGYQIKYTGQAAKMFGSAPRGNFATPGQCLGYWKSRPAFEQNNSKCIETYSQPGQRSDGATTLGWGGRNINSEAGAKQFLLGNMLRIILNNGFNSEPPQVDPARQQEELWQEKQAAIKKQKVAFAKWKQLHDNLARQKAEKQRQKEKEGRNLLSRFDKVGSQDSLKMESISGGNLEPFNAGNLDLPTTEMQPIGTGRYDTSSLSSLKRLACANYLSQRALAYTNKGDAVKARYLNQQSQKVVSGQMIDLECQFPDLPNVPEVQKPVKVLPISNQKEVAYYEGLIKTVHQDAGKLQDIEMKLKKTDKKLMQAKEKKQKAEKQISEIQNHVAMAKNPQEKQEADDLIGLAQALLQEAKNEIQTATNVKQALVKKKEETLTQLKEIQKKIQPRTEAN